MLLLSLTRHISLASLLTAADLLLLLALLRLMCLRNQAAAETNRRIEQLRDRLRALVGKD